MNISIPKTDIQEFCRRNQIRRLSFFGSVLRDDFTAQSNVDVLVEFEPEERIGLITLSGMEIKLSQIFGRQVEIHTLKGLNPLFREEVLEAAEVTYEQA